MFKAPKFVFYIHFRIYTLDMLLDLYVDMYVDNTIWEYLNPYDFNLNPFLPGA